MNDTYILKISSLISYFDSAFNCTNGMYCLNNQGEAEKPITTLVQLMTLLLALPDYQEHTLRQALYLEKIFLKFLTFGHSSLNQWDSCEKNVWCQKNILRQNKVAGKDEASVINILYIKEENESVNTEIADKYETDKKKVGFWYHGTETTALKGIIEKHLMLKECYRPADFSRGKSGGFYVSPHLSAAQEWANYKAEKLRSSPVVIVFNIDQTLRDDKYICLSLYGKDNVNRWKTIVKHFRCQSKSQVPQPVSGPLSRELTQCDYIIGPMHGDGVGGTQYTGNDWSPSIKINSHQLCVKTNRLLEIFDKSIESIIIGPET